jgi:hypothetical protein
VIAKRAKITKSLVSTREATLSAHIGALTGCWADVASWACRTSCLSTQTVVGCHACRLGAGGRVGTEETYNEF